MSSGEKHFYPPLFVLHERCHRLCPGGKIYDFMRKFMEKCKKNF